MSQKLINDKVSLFKTSREPTTIATLVKSLTPQNKKEITVQVASLTESISEKMKSLRNDEAAQRKHFDAWKEKKCREGITKLIF